MNSINEAPKSQSNSSKGRWVTMNGTHVYFDGLGRMTKGPSNIKNYIKNKNAKARSARSRAKKKNLSNESLDQTCNLMTNTQTRQLMELLSEKVDTPSQLTAERYFKTTVSVYKRTLSDQDLLVTIPKSDVEDPRKIIKHILQSLEFTTSEGRSCYRYAGIVAALLDYHKIPYEIYYGYAEPPSINSPRVSDPKLVNHAWVVSNEHIYEKFNGDKSSIKHISVVYKADPKHNTLKYDFALLDQPTNSATKESYWSNLDQLGFVNESSIIEIATAHIQLAMVLVEIVYKIVLYYLDQLDTDNLPNNKRTNLYRTISIKLYDYFMSQQFFDALKIYGSTIDKRELFVLIVINAIQTILTKLLGEYVPRQDCSQVIDHIVGAMSKKLSYYFNKFV